MTFDPVAYDEVADTITPEMIEAGVGEVRVQRDGYIDYEAVAENVYVAMELVRRRHRAENEVAPRQS